MSQRIKGQDVTVSIVSGGDLEDEFTEVIDFEMELDFELKSQGYLGETSQRKDYLFNGAKFNLSLHLKSQRWLLFNMKMLDRATNRTPDLQFNISATLLFPNGDSPVVSLPDCAFGPSPLNVASRGDYVTAKLSGEVGIPDYQTS